MALPGPPELGRAVIVGAGAPAPSAWVDAERVVIDDAALAEPAAVVAALHVAWCDRTPIVIEAAADPAAYREPAVGTGELWVLGPGWEAWVDRLHFLVWANSYDARGDGEPIWWWSRKAGRLGANPGGPADVVLDDGTAAWIDGGPRTPLEVPIDGAVVIHRETIDLGSLREQPSPVAPTADLAPDQLEAVAHGSGPARIIAPAGSGKTRVLTERYRHLLADRGYEREGIVALAYNKQAQEEMASRLPGLGARIQTINAWGYSILSEALGCRPQVLDERDVRSIVERLVPTKQRRVNTDPIQPYLDGLSLIRLGLRQPQEVEDTLDDVPGLAAAFEPYREELRRRGAIDFDEQVYGAVEALVRDGDLRRRIQAGHRHVLVDELQDLTPAHVLLLRLAAGPAADVFGVGDDDQCQPPGTLVTTQRGQVQIEDLIEGLDELTSWDRRSGVLSGGSGSPHAHSRRKYEFKRAERPFEGELVRIRAGDSVTEVTPDHLCIARFTEDAWVSGTGPKVVYLMRKGDWWRIGKCSLRHADTLGPALRMRHEDADAVWILDVIADSREALRVEAVTAANFGLPMTTFLPVYEGRLSDKRSMTDIVKVFEQIERPREKALAVLKAFGRDPRFPFWFPGAERGGRQSMLVRACNLLGDWMAVPVPETKRNVSWVQAKVERRDYAGSVYSLQVSPSPTYIADGIVVHNCIYGHIGADPRFLIDFARYFPGAAAHALEVNYRCAAPVTEAACSLLSYNDVRVAKEIRPAVDVSTDPAAMVVQTDASDTGARALVDAVTGWLAEPGVAPEHVSVLTRVQSLLLAPHVALAEAGVPVDSVLDEGVLNRLGVRAALAYVRIAVDPEHLIGADLSEVHRRPSRGLPQWATKWLDKCRSVDDVRRAAARIDDPKVGAKLDDLAGDLDRLARLAARGATARDLLTAVRDDIGLGSAMTLLDSTGGASGSHLDDLEALLQVADLHPDASSFEAWLRRAFHRERADAGITLSTIHRVKGREWDRVVIFGATEGLMPHRLTEDIEEERRILHVAITRGRHRVLVLGDRTRRSPFLSELDGSAERGHLRQVVATPATASLAAARKALAPPLSPRAESASTALRAWRLERSKADGVPAFVVLSDKHLDGIAERHPSSLTDLRACPGIGPAKLDTYGDEILEVLSAVG